MTESYETIVSRKEGRIGFIAFSRPRALNALEQLLLAETYERASPSTPATIRGSRAISSTVRAAPSPPGSILGRLPQRAPRAPRAVA